MKSTCKVSKIEFLFLYCKDDNRIYGFVLANTMKDVSSVKLWGKIDYSTSWPVYIVISETVVDYELKDKY